eukprot:SAG11_NODE_3383_length_2483_cov_1.276846_1_plen_95_part_00
MVPRYDTHPRAALQQALERYEETVSELDNAVSRTGSSKSLGSLPQSSDVPGLINRIKGVVTQVYAWLHCQSLVCPILVTMVVTCPCSNRPDPYE